MTLREIVARRSWANWWKVDSAPDAGIPITPLQPGEPEWIDADPVIAYMKQRMQRHAGASVDWAVMYEDYSDWWVDNQENGSALSAPEFGAALVYVCERAAIRVKSRRGRRSCLDVRLIDPSLKALVGPAQTAT